MNLHTWDITLQKVWNILIVILLCTYYYSKDIFIKI